MAEYTSGVKFESRTAEANIDRFARKIGTLTSAAKSARDAAGSLSTKVDQVSTKATSAGANLGKLAQGTASFEKSANAAARAANGLISALPVGAISAAAKSLGTLSSRASAAGTGLREAARSAGSLATQSGRAVTQVDKLHRGMTSLSSAARSAATSYAKAMNSLDTGKVGNSVRLLGQLVRSMASSQTRMGEFANNTGRLVTQFGRIGTAGTTASKGIDRVSNSLNTAIPNMRAAANYASQMAAAFGKAGAAAPSISIPKAPRIPSGGGGGGGRAAPAGGYAQGIAQAQKEIQGLGSSIVDLRNIARYYLTGLGVVELAGMIDQVNLVHARLNILSSDYRVVAKAEEDLRRVSLNTRTSYEDNGKLFVKLAQAGKAYGVNMGTAMVITENVSKAMKISGATTAETTAATLQLSQAFASGRFQGDELRSVLENSPRLAQAFSEKLADMGVNLGNIRDFAKKGKIGIQEMVKVLADQSLTEELKEEFKKIPMTMGDALTQTKTNLMFFMADLDKSLGITPKVVSVLKLVGDNFENIAIAAGIAAGAVMLSYVPAMKEAVVQSGRFIALNLFSYGMRIRSAAIGAATAYKDLAGAIKTAATGTGIARLAAIPSTLSGIGTAAMASGAVMAAAFTAGTAAVVIGAAALVAYKSEFRPIRDEAATTQDYLVTGFQSATTAISGAFSSMWNEIARQADEDISHIMQAIDGLYRAAKGVYGAILDLDESSRRFGETARYKLSGGWMGQDYSGQIGPANVGNAKRLMSTGMGEDFGGMVSGTEWQKKANGRAFERYINGPGAWMQNVGGLGFKGYADQPRTVPLPKGGGGGDDGKSGKHSGKSDAEKAADKLKKDREALVKEFEALRNSIDPTEAARSKFNEGVLTLGKSMRAGIIDAAAYKDLLGKLGTDTFTGLTDDIKSLTAENDQLLGKLSGDTTDKRSTEATTKTQEQIDMIDKIIAKQGDATGELSRQKGILNDQLATYTGLVDKNVQLTKAAEDRAAKEKQVADLIENAMNRTQEAFVSAVGNYISGAKSLFSSMLGLVKDTLSQYLGNALFSNIRGGLQKGLEKVFKVDKPIGSAAGSSSVGTAANDNDSKSIIDKTTNSLKVSLTDSSGAKVSDSTVEDTGTSVVMGKKRKPSFVENIRDGYTGSMKGTGDTLLGAVKSLGSVAKKLGLDDFGKKMAGKLGLDGASIGKSIGKGLAGMQVGSATSDLAGALGVKLNKTGSQVGGAIGGMTGIPGGSIIGAVAGGLIGNLFSKPKKGAAQVTGVNGTSDVSVTGNKASYKTAASGMAKNVQSGIQQVADTLGANVGAFNVGIGVVKGAYHVNDRGGQVGKKGSGDIDFKDDQSAAIAYAVAAAVKQGAITGLSETSTRILKTMADTERAIVLAQNIESVKSQAAAIRDPMKAQLDALKKSTDNIRKMFDEAGASAQDYADLNTVVQQQYKDAIEQSMSAILNFRDSLKTGDLSYLSPTAKLSAAQDKFSDFEKKIASGDFSFKQEDFTNAGTNLSNLAREVYGSTPEFAAFQQRLIDATDKVVSNAQATADSYKPVVDALNAQTVAQQKAADIQNELLERIADAVSGDKKVSPFSQSKFAA